MLFPTKTYSVLLIFSFITLLAHANNDSELDIMVAISLASSEIQWLMETDNRALAAKFLRLGFHDCVGGCDGCVDLNNPENFGLDIPINALAPIVNNTRYKAAGLTRADIWALATLTGCNVAHPNSNDFFSLGSYGRVGCEDLGTPCFDVAGEDVGCTPITGPHRDLPLSDLDTDDVLDFFNDAFGFTDQETVALMGAHTLGAAKITNSGFNATRGWVFNNQILDNEYYAQIVGGPQGLFDAPNWNQQLVDNSGIPNFPDRFQWVRPAREGNGRPPQSGPGGTPNNNGEHIIMLNADIALVRTFGSNLNKTTGEVSCDFKNNNQCPLSALLPEMAIYRNNNDLWLTDFKAVVEKMLANGYIIDSNCTSHTCLTPLFDSQSVSPTIAPVEVTSSPTKASSVDDTSSSATMSSNDSSSSPYVTTSINSLCCLLLLCIIYIY